MKIFYLFLGVFLLGSCTNNDDAEQKKAYAGLEGQYRIVAFEANEAVDLDNNKVLSRDLMTEITNIKNLRPYFEVLPNELNQTKVELLSFILPKSQLGYTNSTNIPTYANFPISVYNTEFKFENEAFIPKSKTYTESGSENGVESSHEIVFLWDFDVVDATHVRTYVKKSYYDFATHSWKSLNIKVLYERFEY